MSYDLVVFDPRAQLRDRATFMAWYDARTEWEDGLDYNEPSNASPALQDWFREMIATFPPMNGQLRPADFADNEWTADYSIARDLILVAFPSSKGMHAYELSRHLAGKHGVGFFDASGDGGAWFPAGGETLELAHASDPSEGADAGLEKLLRRMERAWKKS
jgi:hypothetical protein